MERLRVSNKTLFEEKSQKIDSSAKNVIDRTADESDGFKSIVKKKIKTAKTTKDKVAPASASSR